jgi:hypothetical protein
MSSLSRGEDRDSKSLRHYHKFLWRIRLAVRTPVFQAGYLGSNPGCATSFLKWPRSSAESERSFPKADAASSSLAGVSKVCLTRACSSPE